MSIGIAHPDVSRRVERYEVLLTFRGLLEHVRLGLRDTRRLIRQLIAARDTAAGSSEVQITVDPTPLVSVPLVVLRPTTDREQIELHALVQSLDAEGYQVAPSGSQWVVYTEIADRRKSAIGGSFHDRRGLATMGGEGRSGSLRHRGRDCQINPIFESC